MDDEAKILLQSLSRDLSEVKSDQKELVKQGAAHNVLLQQHEARSLALQQEQKLQAQSLEPIKRHVDFVNALGKAFLAIALGVSTYWLSHSFF